MGFPVPLSELYQRDPVRSFVRDTLMSGCITANVAGLTQKK